LFFCYPFFSWLKLIGRDDTRGRQYIQPWFIFFSLVFLEEIDTPASCRHGQFDKAGSAISGKSFA